MVPDNHRRYFENISRTNEGEGTLNTLFASFNVVLYRKTRGRGRAFHLLSFSEHTPSARLKLLFDSEQGDLA